jgi:threonine dehydratase
MFDQPETLLRQGTLARELTSQVPDATTLLVAVGGGSDRRHRRLVRRPENVCDWRRTRLGAHSQRGTEGWKTGRCGSRRHRRRLAPKRVGELMFPIAQQHVERVVLVDDDDIVRAQDVLWELFRLVVEPGGAAAFAAILARRYTPQPGEVVVVVLCGGNAQR